MNCVVREHTLLKPDILVETLAGFSDKSRDRCMNHSKVRQRLSSLAIIACASFLGACAYVDQMKTESVGPKADHRLAAPMTAARPYQGRPVGAGTLVNKYTGAKRVSAPVTRLSGGPYVCTPSGFGRTARCSVR